MASFAASASDSDQPAPSDAIQLLLRNIDSRTIVVRAQLDDTLDSVLERLGHGKAAVDLRAMHAGPTIGELEIPPNATLHVISRLRSTPYTSAFKLAARIAAACTGQEQPPDSAAASLVSLVSNFLEAVSLAARVSNNTEVWTAPLLLELCSSIASGARPQPDHDDPLYADLRRALAAVLADPKWNSPACWLDMPPDWVAEHLTRLAVENADAVTGAHLTLTADE
ncbi:hypothetical protein PR202_ga21416 [Eleusine coracana subsp. coracana]|uniref:Uncharacterized protein n=1 Tax=Eleusine coracana subsp. coracana TaxID=191504 RepID=A0AAV5D0Y8_ELECO|nr:hypothetical protein PR202_ga21416 [Eleusine coracana subsp. coracana]